MLLAAASREPPPLSDGPLGDGPLDKLVKLILLLGIKRDASEILLEWTERPDRLRSFVERFPEDSPGRQGAGLSSEQGGTVVITVDSDGGTSLEMVLPPNLWPPVRDRILGLGGTAPVGPGDDLGRFGLSLRSGEIGFSIDWEREADAELVVLVRLVSEETPG